MVVRGGDERSTIRVGHGKVDPPGVVNPNRRIAVAGRTLERGIANVPDFPGYPIVFRDDDRAIAATGVVRQVDGAISRRDLHVSVQAAALRRIGLDRRTPGSATVITPQTKGGDEIL